MNLLGAGEIVDGDDDFHPAEARQPLAPFPLQPRNEFGVFQDDESLDKLAEKAGRMLVDGRNDVDGVIVDVDDEEALLQPAPSRHDRQIAQV